MYNAQFSARPPLRFLARPPVQNHHGWQLVRSLGQSRQVVNKDSNVFRRMRLARHFNQDRSHQPLLMLLRLVRATHPTQSG